MSTNEIKTKRINHSHCETCGYEEIMYADATAICPRCGGNAGQRTNRWIEWPIDRPIYNNDIPVKI